jgi:predicted MPP superfamily phosphohydrolase
MLHIRVVSDLHLEHHFDFYANPLIAAELVEKIVAPLPTDKKSVLIVAGDLTAGQRPERAKTFFELVCDRFAHTIYVLGNHEHYGMQLEQTQQVLQDTIHTDISEEKLTIVGDKLKKIEIGGVAFLCGTMWTDYGNGNAEVHEVISSCVNDHNYIRSQRNASGPFQDGRVTPAILAEVHGEFIADLRAELSRSDNQKTVIVTHHMPSFSAVDPQYTLTRGSRLINHAFASNMDQLMIEFSPAYWFFGHTHTKYEGKVGETTIYCNPHGYPREAQAKPPYDSTRIFAL